MRKYFLFLCFALFAAGLSAQTFSFKDTTEISAFKEWLFRLKNSGASNGYADAFDQHLRTAYNESCTRLTPKTVGKYSELEGDALKEAFLADLGELSSALISASGKYKKMADDEALRNVPSAVMNRAAYLETSSAYQKDAAYFNSISERIAADGIASLEVKHLRFAGNLLNAMTDALKKHSGKFYNEFKKEFNASAKKAGIKI